MNNKPPVPNAFLPLRACNEMRNYEFNWSGLNGRNCSASVILTQEKLS